jgi:hypothetical protein
MFLVGRPLHLPKRYDFSALTRSSESMLYPTDVP